MSDLESLVGRVCREQPPLRAPDGLIGGVLAEIERRAALPWWRRSFAFWPVTVRIAFLLACGAAVAGLFSQPLAPLLAGPSQPLTWLLQAFARIAIVNNALGHVGADLVHRVSPLLLYGAAAGICLLYLVLAGLAATTYRTLYIAR